jgi:hypothetical protein
MEAYSQHPLDLTVNIDVSKQPHTPDTAMPGTKEQGQVITKKLATSANSSPKPPKLVPPRRAASDSAK